MCRRRIFSKLRHPAAAKLLDWSFGRVRSLAMRTGSTGAAGESVRAIESGFFQIRIRSVGFYRNPIAAA